MRVQLAAALVAIQASDPSPQIQSSAGAASVTFSAPSGGTGSYSYSASLTKPSGSSASLSGSGLGAYTFTTDVAGSYVVTLTITDGKGVTTTASGVVALEASTSSYEWTLVKYLDLTQATTQSGLGTDGTYTAVVGSDSLPLVVTHTNPLDPTTTATLTNGTGLVVSCVAGSATSWNKMFGFKVSDLVGDLKPDSNLLRIEALIEVTTLNGTSDLISFEVGDGPPITAAYPEFGVGLIKYGANDWRFRVTRRNTTAATHTTMSSAFSVTQPTAFHPEIYAWGLWSRGFADAGTSWSANAYSITAFASYLGQDAVPGATSNPTFWSSTQYVVFMLAGSTVGTVSATLKGFKIYSASKRLT